MSLSLSRIEAEHVHHACDVRPEFYESCRDAALMDAPSLLPRGSAVFQGEEWGAYDNGFCGSREHVGCFFCPSAGASAEVNEAPSLGRSGASGQQAGIRIDLISVPGRRARHESGRDRVRAHRQAHARLDVTVKPETKASIESIARELGFNANEVVRELLAFALTNRNWKQVGLVGRGAL